MKASARYNKDSFSYLSAPFKPDLILLAEKDRYRFEKTLLNEGYENIMGLDEVGRGCLAGPVVAAGVILNKEVRIDGLRDSKQIPKEERERLADEVKEKALAWRIVEMSPKEIDEHNILRASLMAMQQCAETSEVTPDFLLVDGNKYTNSLIPFRCIVKGDDKSASIAAASIIAKVYRDDLMHKLHQTYPFFGWDTNVGYPTKKHFEGLARVGYTKYHRMSFSLRTDKVFSEKKADKNA